jgi:hypothetical protein
MRSSSIRDASWGAGYEKSLKESAFRSLRLALLTARIVAALGLQGIDGKDRSNNSTTTRRSLRMPIFHAGYQRFDGTLLPSLVIDKIRKQKSTENPSTTFPNFSC